MKAFTKVAPRKGAILRTACPPAATAAWYARHRPCSFCRATILRRRESGEVAFLDVQHSPDCSLTKLDLRKIVGAPREDTGE